MACVDGTETQQHSPGLFQGMPFRKVTKVVVDPHALMKADGLSQLHRLSSSPTISSVKWRHCGPSEAPVTAPTLLGCSLVFTRFYTTAHGCSPDP